MITNPKRILIVKLGAIGDVVHALPVAATLRKRFPDAYIAWVIEKKSASIVENNPNLDDVFIIDTKRWRKEPGFKTVLEVIRLWKSLRSKQFDVAIDLQGLIKSGIIMWLSGAKKRVGFISSECREKLNGMFTNKKVHGGKNSKHVIDMCLALTEPLGVENVVTSFFLYIPEEEHSYINKFLFNKRIPKDKPVIILNPGAGWKTKEWGVDNFGALGDRIVSEIDCSIVITWGPGEQEMATSIQKMIHKNVFIAPPTTLRQSLALLEKSDLFIGGDTGPMHLAVALGTSTVALFGPSDPQRNGPYGKGHEVVHHPLVCGNCYKRTCESTECMDLITVEEVFKKAQKSLSSVLQNSHSKKVAC